MSPLQGSKPRRAEIHHKKAPSYEGGGESGVFEVCCDVEHICWQHDQRTVYLGHPCYLKGCKRGLRPAPVILAMLPTDVFLVVLDGLLFSSPSNRLDSAQIIHALDACASP